ncbi:VOC family protein [Loktanella sp. R86503]|uniref:VOC family protein n=1 Tax=Loktanella sp. R86503 TaxID=3093847 RepID=UPI0036DAA369
MPALEAILETAIYVADLRRACAFYEDIMGLRPLEKADRLCAYSVNERSVLLIFARGGTADGATADGDNEIPPHDATGQIHFAFQATHDAFDAWDNHLTAQGVEILSRTSWMRGGKSMYFRDPDENLVEIAASPGLWPMDGTTA